MYRHALAALGTRPEDAFMVGDHLEWDVGAPQRLGVRGVWVDGAGRASPISRSWSRTGSSAPSPNWWGTNRRPDLLPGAPA